MLGGNGRLDGDKLEEGGRWEGTHFGGNERWKGEWLEEEETGDERG